VKTIKFFQCLNTILIGTAIWVITSYVPSWPGLTLFILVLVIAFASYIEGYWVGKNNHDGDLPPTAPVTQTKKSN
jgi:uncharacterized membrane protein